MFEQGHGAGEKFREKGVQLFDEIQSPAYPDDAGKVGRYRPRFQPLHGPLGDPGPQGKIGLGKILIQAKSRQPSSDLTEYRIICIVYGYFHNTSIMANYIAIVKTIRHNRRYVSDTILFATYGGLAVTHQDYSSFLATCKYTTQMTQGGQPLADRQGIGKIHPFGFFQAEVPLRG
jgi:hypothetical protein